MAILAWGQTGYMAVLGDNMDTNEVEIVDGKKYNKFGQQIIRCAICGDPTTMTSTEHCDRCHELDLRIRMDLDIAERIVNYYKAK